MNMVKKIYFCFTVLAIIYNINIINPTVSGYLVDLFTKQDKSQEINSEDNSGVVSNVKNNSGIVDNSGTTNNYYYTYPYVPPLLNITNKIKNSYDLYVIFKMLTNFFKTNPYVYEIFKNDLEGELFKSQDFTHTPKAQRSINE